MVLSTWHDVRAGLCRMQRVVRQLAVRRCVVCELGLVYEAYAPRCCWAGQALPCAVHEGDAAQYKLELVSLYLVAAAMHPASSPAEQGACSLQSQPAQNAVGRLRCITGSQYQSRQPRAHRVGAGLVELEGVGCGVAVGSFVPVVYSHLDDWAGRGSWHVDELHGDVQLHSGVHYDLSACKQSVPLSCWAKRPG